MIDADSSSSVADMDDDSTMVDDDDQAEILDYFKNCETSSLDIAKSELADLDLEWEQLKIMRIKFLCDYGI